MHDDDILPQSEVPLLEPLANESRTIHPPMLGHNPDVLASLNAIAYAFIPQDLTRGDLPTTTITHPQRVARLDMSTEPHKDGFQKG